MKKILIIAVIIGFVFVGFVYRDAIMKAFQGDRCPEEGTVWDPSRGECVTIDTEGEGEGTEAPNEEADLSGIERINLAIEGALNGTVAIARSEGTQPFSMTFTQGGPAPIEGFVFANIDRAVVHAASGDVFMPYSVSYGGSGTFVSVGLFTRSGSTLTLEDSYEIGDRLPVDSLSTDGVEADSYTLVINFRDRVTGAAMVAEPTVEKRARIPVRSHVFGTVEVSVINGGDSSYKDLIRVSAPESGAEVDSPLTVRGDARGMWYFEASFPIDVLDADGEIIGQGYATADGDWMTESYVPFVGEITFDLPIGASGTEGVVVFHKSNASGLPERDDAFSVPVTFE